ncbi:uncharacterized protein LOC144607329 [Rhinoraja longicauda]
MAEIAPIKADIAAAIPPDLTSGPVSSAPPAPLAATKKKAAYRPQKGAATAAAEQILEAVAATKERQVAKMGAGKKTLSAAGCRTDKVGARPNQSGSALANKCAPSEDGTDTSAATLPERDTEPRAAEGEQGEGKDRNKRIFKRKAPARKMGPRTAVGVKPAAQKRAKKPAAKKVSKRPASRAGGRQRRGARKSQLRAGGTSGYGTSCLA